MPSPQADSAYARFIAAVQAGRAQEATHALLELRTVASGSARTRYAEGLQALVAGDDARALAPLGDAARALPDDAAVQANYALCLQRLDRHADALAQLEHVCALAPRHADAHYNLAISLAALRRDADAIAAWQRAVQLQPAHAQAWTRLADALQRRGRWRDALAACERALDLRADHAGLQAQRARLLLELGDADAALALAQRVAAEHPDSFEAVATLASACFHLQRYEACEEAATRALQRQAEAADMLRLRGLARQALHRLDDAARDVIAAARLRFAPGPDTAPILEHRLASRPKLRHDLEQLSLLRERGALPDADALIDAHAAALADPRIAGGDGEVFELDTEQLRALRHGYNRLHHLAPAPRAAQGALSPDIDFAAIARDYAAREPGITWIDGLLRSEALGTLQRYCRESTLWFDCRHANGYLGAFFEDGFAAPLLLQIAEELRAAAPSIFRDHPLVQMWAFKYDSRLDGIELHADIAAVNVNFWITPDEANLDPERGGLLVWDRKAPADWSLDEFNTSSAAGQSRIRDFLERESARCIRVPYRCNRAVIFHSDLFHRTDTIRFAPDYEHRRINVTMLFGRREGRRA